LQLERYRQLSFDGIPSFPNLIPNDVRNILAKFSRNNALSREDYLRAFLNLLDDYEIESEDGVMKLFTQSLVEDARDWYRGLPEASIGSWEEFKRVFREQYHDTIDL